MKKIMQRAFVVLTSVALLVTSATPVFATSEGHGHNGGTKIASSKGCDYTITLKHPDATITFGDNSHYGAYQIFSGIVEGKKEDEPIQAPGGNGKEESKTIPITDIKWGNAFGITEAMDSTAGDTVTQSDIDKRIVGFVIALATARKGAYSYAFAEFDGFENSDPDKAFVKEDGGEYYLADRFIKSGSANINEESDAAALRNVDYDKLAVAVADVLADKDHIDNHEWLQAFTDILGGYAQGSGGDYKVTGYVNRFYEGTRTSDNKKYEIKVPAGYYMIRDLSSVAGTDGSYSARMLFVANNVEQVLKEDVPTLDKKIVRDSGLYETEVAGVGDEVKFQLKGTLPGNYDLYLGGYKFIFTDTLSKGLTLKQLANGGYDVTVTVKGVWNGDVWSDDTFTISTSSVKEDGEHTHDASVAYTIKYDTSENILTVSFPCLKEISITNGGATYTLGVNGAKKSEIYIDYTAVVDSDAIVNPAKDGKENGNTNTAVLTYSDNPQSYEDTDDTTEDNANVYVFGLDIVKIDAAEYLRTGTEKGTAALTGAKFALVRPAKDADGHDIWEIASFDTVLPANVEKDANLPANFIKYGYYTIKGWKTIKGSTDQTAFDSAWLGEDSDYYNKDTYNIASLTDGVLNISGLDVDVTYTMVETEAPDKYAIIQPFTIKLTAQKNTGGTEYTGALADAESGAEVSEGASFSFKNPVEITDKFDASDDGSANMLVANFKYIDLPSTGGVGTYLFYIIGGGIIVLSAVLFIFSKKKTTK